MPDEARLGARLRDLRRARGLAARTVAERSGVSAAYLSRLEHGKVSPTVSTLTRVVSAMGESVASLFGDDESGPVVRRDERGLVRHQGVDDFRVTPGRARRLEIIETFVQPGAGSGDDEYTYPADEQCLLVLEGALRVWLDGAPYDLGEGDAITFPSRTPHRWENPGESTTRALCIVTPARH